VPKKYINPIFSELTLKQTINYKLVCIMATKKEFNSFEEMLSGSDVPVLVDFYADWCGPCQMMVPILEQVNLQLKDRLRIVKIDTEKYTELASQYGITALPTLVLFKQGKPIDKIEGVMQVPQLVKHLQPLL
jgi:thioredoxin